MPVALAPQLVERELTEVDGFTEMSARPCGCARRWRGSLLVCFLLPYGQTVRQSIATID